MQKYLNAIGVLTLVVLIPVCAGTLYSLLVGDITFDQYSAYWKEPIILLFGFWLRGAAGADAPKAV